MSKTRTMTMSLHNVNMRTVTDDRGLHRWLVVEDYSQGTCVRRVKIPLYGTNVRFIARVLREWRDALLDEAKAVDDE
jgi:hypothetical protein